MKEDKLFKPDYSEPKFTIKIQVFDNCSKFSMEIDKEGYEPTYEQMIGVLEITKNNFIMAQSSHNRKQHNRTNPQKPSDDGK